VAENLEVVSASTVTEPSGR